MNNSAKFKKAHQIAKDTVKAVGDYQIAFTIALRKLVAEEKARKAQYMVNLPDAFDISAIILIIVWVIMSIVTFNSLPVIGLLLSLVIAGLTATLSYIIISLSGMYTIWSLKRNNRMVMPALDDNSFYVWPL